ncbi:MAG: tRNA epoxyqueuosine(34) reductase QueG [Phycisphaerales bacterium]
MSLPGAPILARCRELGFALAGVCEAAPTAHEGALRDWLGAGKHGAMGWLADNIDKRCDPAHALPGARSIILVADQYASRSDAPDDRTHGVGRVARYARGADYHKTIKKRLHALADDLRERHPDSEFRAFVDTAPVLEREHASRAGLGWIGKHTLLIHPKVGSYVLLGGVLTTLDLEPPAEQSPVPDHCGACTRCIEACPTDAITPHSVDATRCIAYLTIEHRERIHPQFHEPIGDWLFGCDICQEVCPHNTPRGAGAAVGEPHEAYAPRRSGFDLLEVLDWSEDDRRAAFTTSSMKRANLAMMRRNAVICAANALRERDDAALRSRIRAIAADEAEDALVRATARNALAFLDQA